LERETGIEPATNSLEGCDSTTELLPPGYSTSAEFPIVTLIQAKARIYGYSRPVATSKYVELTERLELSTSPLPRECSTTELRQPFANLKTNLVKLVDLYNPIANAAVRV
jgi:hypothetical protein